MKINIIAGISWFSIYYSHHLIYFSCCWSCCGKGYCDLCSSKRKVIEWWSKSENARVCDECFVKKDPKEPVLDTTSRKLSEAFKDTIGFISGVTINYPLNMIKESTRPLYWTPGNVISVFFLIKLIFVLLRRRMFKMLYLFKRF